MNTYTFIISSIIIILLPGTVVIYTISKELVNEKKSSTIATLGCTVDIIPHLIISICFSSLILGSVVYKSDKDGNTSNRKY